MTYDIATQSIGELQIGDIINCSYSGTFKALILPPGTYKLECWGAQGGIYNSSTAAPYCKGGYSVGTITLSKESHVCCYVGGQGAATTNTSQIALGGFNGGGACWGQEDGNAGGGGASDIRINSTSLYARVIVAGGGGGEGEDDEGPGYGGGISGGKSGSGVSGGTQTGTGTGGAFGIGASTNYDGGGCGGGWYGGGTSGGTQSIPTSQGSGSDTSGGSGGSGYVYTSETAINYPSGCLLDDSMYLTDAETIAGNASFPSTSGGTETGHAGNGYVRITVINIIREEIELEPLPTPEVKSVNSSDAISVSKIRPILVYNFPYTGKVKYVTLPKGVYKFECWGAQGGTYSSIVGGKGGYSKGILTLENNTNIYIYVGGRGSSSDAFAGFNGGGFGTMNGRGGGGASDIRINENSLYSRIIVAGGGGGAGVSAGSVSYAGCGGGTYGGDGYSNNTTGSYITGQNRSGGSASQTAGGISWQSIESTRGTFGKGGDAYLYSCGGGGGGWYGGGGAYDSDSDADGKSGGGGSGYVYTTQTQSNYPQGCLLNSDYYLEDAETIAGNASFPATTSGNETGHTGDGYVRITYMLPSCFVIKVDGFWKAIDIFMKNNGDIKKIESVSSLINNTWKSLNI